MKHEIKIEKRTEGERKAYLEGYEAGKKNEKYNNEHMTFSERVKLLEEYRTWRISENKKHDYKMGYDPETFLSFLAIKGYKIIKKEENNET